MSWDHDKHEAACQKCGRRVFVIEGREDGLRLIDGDELVALIFQHYERFDARHKGLLPLRRVYVPELIESDEE